MTRKALLIPAVLAAGIAIAPIAHADGTQASLNDAVRQVYTQVQTRCTPTMPPNFQGIQLTGDGEGRIIDANPSLGGPFQYLRGPPESVGVPGAPSHRVQDHPNGDCYITLESC